MMMMMMMMMMMIVFIAFIAFIAIIAIIVIIGVIFHSDNMMGQHLFIIPFLAGMCIASLKTSGFFFPTAICLGCIGQQWRTYSMNIFNGLWCDKN